MNHRRTTMRLLALTLVLLLSPRGFAAEPKRDHHGDPLPEGAVARLGSLHLRDTSLVFDVDYSPDGKLLAATAGGRFIICWDPATGREARRVPVPVPLHGMGSRVRFSDDGKSLILVSNEAVHIVDAVAGVEQRKLAPNERDIRAFTISRNGKIAVTIAGPDSLVVWDVTSGKRRRQFKLGMEFSRGSNSRIALTHEGKQLVLTHPDDSLYLLDLTSGEKVFNFEKPPNRPQGTGDNFLMPTISSDGRYLVCGYRSNYASLYDLKNGKLIRQWRLSPKTASALALTLDNRSLAVSDGEYIHLFDVSSGKEQKTFRHWWHGNLVFSRDGRQLAAASGTCIYQWDVKTSQRRHSPSGHPWFITALLFSADGKRLVSNTNGEMIAWDVDASRPLAVYRSGHPQQWVGFAADDKTIRYLDLLYKESPRGRGKGKWAKKDVEVKEQPRPSGTIKRTIQRWDLATNRGEPETDFSIPQACDWFELSPDGRRVVLLTDGTVQMRALEGGKPLETVARTVAGWSKAVQFSPDGRRLIVRTPDSGVSVLDASGGKLLRHWESTSPHYISLVSNLSADGRILALVMDDRLRIREVASGADRLRILEAEAWDKLTLSPNGLYVAAVSHKGKEPSIRVFSTTTGKLLANWVGERSQTTALAFSRDSRLLASGSYDGTILLWKIPENPSPPISLSVKQVAAFWKTLADRDAQPANFALACLADAPAQALPLIKERFHAPRQPRTAAELARLIDDLDADTFKTRERATQELSEAGTDAADLLHKALANKPSPEARQRIESVLKRLDDRIDPEHLRALRAIEVLERIGTTEAKKLLRELAAKPLPAELHEDIEASLRRIEVRSPTASRGVPTP